MQTHRSPAFLQQHIRNIPTTLPTALHQLNLSPKFDIYACCPQCSRLYPQPSPQTELPVTCNARNLDGLECGVSLSTTHRRGNISWQRPILRYSHMRFETWISEMLMCPGMEDSFEAGRPNLKPGSAMANVWDAPYVCAFPNPDQPSFMDAPEDELRLIMMLHYDYFNPFGLMAAGKNRSVGCFFMICLNLPPDCRYNASNAYLVSMIPGPSEPKLENQPMFVGPIVNDMMELYSTGIWISRTHKYPNGRRVRAAIAIKSMDTPAARGAGGFATHSHTRFCHACNATLDKIDCTCLQHFQLRNNESHRAQVSHWGNAKSIKDQKKIYDLYGVRWVDWLKFPWWNPTDVIVVGPMHWSKNILDKQLRQNMAWNWTIPAGLPEDIPSSIQPITELEYHWGSRAFLCLDEANFQKAGLTAPLIHYLCRQRNIYEAGLSSLRLIKDLNQWQRTHSLISEDGSRTPYAIQKFGDGTDIPLARAHFYVSKIPAASISSVSQHTRILDLKQLCKDQNLDIQGSKEELIKRLQASFANVRVPNMPDVAPPTKSNKNSQTTSLLGFEVLDQIQRDMEQTTLPSWIKYPPINFATVDHGTLQAEEMKSLAMVSFTITLVRLWGQHNSDPQLRYRLDHFLNLMIAVCILALQSITELDISAFEIHYDAYLQGLKSLYPACTSVPVQHFGLHIPHYLRALGPSTRYTESTCEQFIGMFRKITTNFKFGDLELTLHREFVMGSRLKGLFECEGFTTPLDEFGEVVQEFLQKHIPSQSKQTWKATHPSEPTFVSDSVYDALQAWSHSWSAPALPRRLYICSRIRLANVTYAPYTTSKGDSRILFNPPGQNIVALLPGQIEFILKEPEGATGESRIVLLVRPFQSLTAEDSLHDLYANHPLIGSAGAGFAQLYYEEMANETYLIEPRNLVSHIATCPFTDPETTISRKALVILSLDLVSLPILILPTASDLYF
ncbi:transposase family Tnp2 protein [Rhizoctonia solani 123E]|uniref:Transposase family Tnp2 protein n=1 Tax=Rhizoctonia solani 123E TaxID=1423351 RepID=A0A074SE44_9AGAM|nr:transposase family Tnp2 protein [Rhizoctonia solani 123E]